MTSHAGPPGYQPGERVILIATTDPRTRLTPGTRGTVTGRNDRHGQFSDCSVLLIPLNCDFTSRTCP